MSRPTRRGWALLAAAVGVFALGSLLGHPLLRVLAGACIGAVGVALLLTARAPEVHVSRDVYPDRVRRGDPAFARLRVRNPGTRHRPGFLAGDRIGPGYVTVPVRALPPGAEAVHHYDLPTARRGHFEVGPLTLRRVDPLGLTENIQGTGSTTTLWVHPRTHPMRAPSAGHPRHHHEGGTTDRSPLGSQDLRDIREYVVGDEVRHLHWKATARTGKLMTRHYVDPDQPRATVLLDTRIPGDLLEEAVDVAASLVTASAAAGRRCRLVTPCGVDLASGGDPASARVLLDELSLVGRASAALPLAPAGLTRSGGGFLAVVCAGLDAGDLAVLAHARPAYGRTVVVALGASVVVPDFGVVRAVDAADAARRWNAGVLS